MVPENAYIHMQSYILAKNISQSCILIVNLIKEQHFKINWVPKKLPQIYTVIAYICIGRVA